MSRWTALLAVVVVVAMGGMVGEGVGTEGEATPVAGEGSPVAATPAAGPVALPAPTGPFAVGRSIVDWVDATRRETFSTDPRDARELAVWFWYPAAPTDAPPAAYLPGRWADEIGRLLRFDPSQVRAHAVADAPLAAADAKFPLLILSPGNASYPGAYTALAEELASHGYVVAAIGHTYNAVVTVFPDGRVVPASPLAQMPPGSLQVQARTGTMLADVQAADVRFVLDRLGRVNAEPGPWRGRLDLDRVGVLGHSLGGAAAAEACRIDLRCRAGVNLDGAVWGPVAQTGAPVPFLLIESDHLPCTEQKTFGIDAIQHCEEAEQQFVDGWDRVVRRARPGLWLSISGSRHAGFSDAPFLPARPGAPGELMAGATIAPERMWRVTSDLLLAFFGKYLKDETASLLAAPSATFPEVKPVTP